MPFIVKWPGVVDQGTVSEDLINLIDIFATLSDVTGNDLPEHKDVAPDSFSFLPSLLKRANEHPRLSMVTADAKGMHAIRIGNWKYIDNTPPEGFPEKRMKQYQNEIPQLYNLVTDPGEKKNLIEEYPDKAKELMDELKRIRTASATR